MQILPHTTGRVDRDRSNVDVHEPPFALVERGTVKGRTWHTPGVLSVPHTNPWCCNSNCNRSATHHHPVEALRDSWVSNHLFERIGEPRLHGQQRGSGNAPGGKCAFKPGRAVKEQILRWLLKVLVCPAGERSWAVVNAWAAGKVLSSGYGECAGCRAMWNGKHRPCRAVWNGKHRPCCPYQCHRC